MIRQQELLLATEGVQLQFTEEAIHEIARVAEEINRNVDNIGARRLHTVIERIVEDISFSAPDKVIALLLHECVKGVFDAFSSMPLPKCWPYSFMNVEGVVDTFSSMPLTT